MHTPRSAYILAGIEGTLIALGAFLTPFLRSRRNRWGLSQAAADRDYPSDAYISQPRWGFTHGIHIAAPAEAVWPWVAQIGQDKGGFYSYELLENLVGCQMVNADRIVPKWQELHVGDSFNLHPEAGIPIVLVEPGRAFAAGMAVDLDSGETFDPAQGLPNRYMNLCWLFYVEALEDGSSRFISHWQIGYTPSLANHLMYGPLIIEPVAFTMDRKMLLGVKQRAEAA
jgi:hypothetical protein